MGIKRGAYTTIRMVSTAAVAVFDTRSVKGETTFKDTKAGVRITAVFTRLPEGLHGFHIHEAGDLRGEGCMKACAHYHVGAPQDHGGPPGSTSHRHTGDLGNVGELGVPYTFVLKGVQCADLFGRALIVHGGVDDYGMGDYPDSKTTGHSGKRIACAIIGRAEGC